MADTLRIVSIILIPFISGVVGYITNVVAVWMTFHPTEFWPWKVWQPKGQPIGLFGWQGIIPAKAVEMAQIMCDVFLERVVDVPQIFSRVDPQHIADITRPRTQEVSVKIVEHVAMNEVPDLWRALSPHVRQDIQNLTLSSAERYIELLLKALKGCILHILDIRTMIGRLTEQDKAALSNMFLDVGAKEFKFIQNSGLYFGFLFGIIQAVVYIFYDAAWVLPVCGFLVGYATNWIALKLIFEPARPWHLGPIRVQGLFLRRQHEASAAMARVCKSTYLDQRMLWSEVCYGPRQSEWHELLDDVARDLVQDQTERTAWQRIGIAVLVGQERLTRIRQRAVKIAQQEIPGVLELTYGYMDEVMQVETDIREALQAMPPDEFIGILRPVFQQDELKLIIVGGVLGALAGAFQQFVLYDMLL